MSGFMRWSCLVLLSGFLIQQLRCQVLGKNSDCESYGECSECLRHLGCVWCIKPNISRKSHKNDLIHCYPRESLIYSICDPENLVDPPSTEEITSQKPLQSKQGGHVQVTPQKVKLTMRLGEEKKINFQFAQSEEYPVDLYYIMDLSASMETHREKLGNLGSELALTMRNITNNFRIGFGSFVDKVQSPFVNTLPQKLKSPCRLIKKNEVIYCVSPYSFKNHMSLDGNYEKFSHEVSRAKISGNMDSPEGGFDAIMQAIVCKKQIGWRDQARHLLVFSTDASFHIAGDGRLIGVVEPNDGKCHMSHDQYDSYLEYDYPSISHLNYIAKKNNINLIFAIVKTKYSKNILKTYEDLSKNIENSYIGALEGNSDNVIKLVLDNYNKIVDSVIIDVNSTDNIEVQLSSNCTTPKINGCSDIHVGEIINFTATIKPLTCTGYKGEPISIMLKPDGIDENLTIEIDLICGCDCEKRESPHFIEKSNKCSNAGDLTCGVCACAPGRYGTHCECDGEQANSYNETNCIERPGASVCSGLGRCKCGVCECFKSSNENEMISGKFCQCSNSSCEWDGGLLCAGNGDCSCGVCQCKAGWGGTSCSCLERNATCIREGDSAVCSGNGICSCGKCECITDYTGKYCEECPTCRDRCEDIKNCVECIVFKSGPLKKMCSLNCTEYYIEEVDELSPITGDQKYKLCRTIDDHRCTTVHRYRYDKDQNIIIEVLKKKSCPPSILVWALGVIGTIFLAGLTMLLIWKAFTTIHDKREYVRFENERKKVKWHTNENPLYKDATTTFQNPVYKS